MEILELMFVLLEPPGPERHPQEVVPQVNYLGLKA